MRISKYLPFALIYFFVNSLGLPFGLTYMAILSPVLYWWIIVQREREILIPFVIALAPFVIAQVWSGVATGAYIISLFNYAAVYIFCQAFFTFLHVCDDVVSILKKILVINFLLCVVALLVYYTPYYDWFWMEQDISDGVEAVRRLKMFTYEPSHYAMVFTPVFFFFVSRLVLKMEHMNAWLSIIMLLLPLVLSFSLGIITAILFAIAVAGMLHFKSIMVTKRAWNLVAIMAAASFFIILLLALFPGNSLFTRLENIFAGNDTSGKGRTSDAYLLSREILRQGSEWWGIGAGQIKIAGADIIRSYYLYDLNYENIAIPNAAAETLAIFGWIGLFVRLVTEVVLFFFTRVWNSYFRSLLFFFMFLYQFTGSFITNPAEYVIWILAFTSVFPALEHSRSNKHP